MAQNSASAAWCSSNISRPVQGMGHYRETRAPPSGICGFTETAFWEANSSCLCVYICVSVDAIQRTALADGL